MVFTRSEKEELVVQLYEEGKTIREIAKAVHMSFTDISATIKKETGENGKDSNYKPITSKETEALKLFQEGKSPVDAATTLGISSDEIEGLYFVKLYRILRSAGIAVEEAADLFNEAQHVSFLRNTFLDLTNANTSLQEQNNNLISELSRVQNEVDTKRGYLQWYKEELKRIIFEIEKRYGQVRRLESMRSVVQLIQ